MASRPPVHCLSIVKPPICSGRPEAKAVGLAGLPPPPTAFESINSFTDVVGTLASFNRALMTGAASS